MTNQWFKNKYFHDGETISIVPGGQVEYYDPFSFYKEGNRVKDNLHHIFASIDVSNHSKIVDFYNDYGPLGIIGRDIVKIMRSCSSEGKRTGILVVSHDSDELMPVRQFLEEYDVPIEEFVNKYLKKKVIPSLREVSVYTGESIERFRYHHERFRWTLDMLTAVFLDNQDWIAKLLADKRPSIASLAALTGKKVYGSEAEQHAVAIDIVMNHINNELANRGSVKVSADKGYRSVSKDLEWSFDSLLTVMYLMVVMDIQRGVVSRHCEACDGYFETNRADIKYCTPKCQSRMNTRKHLEEKRKVLEMAAAGESTKKIAAKTGKKAEQIKKWILEAERE